MLNASKIIALWIMTGLMLNPSPVEAGSVVMSHCNRLLSMGSVSAPVPSESPQISDEILSESLAQVLNDSAANPWLRMRVAVFVKNYPGYTAEMKLQAEQALAQIDSNPLYKNIRADLNAIKQTSFFY